MSRLNSGERSKSERRMIAAWPPVVCRFSPAAPKLDSVDLLHHIELSPS